MELKFLMRLTQFLEKYRWSSYHAYCGKKKTLFNISTELFQEVFGNVEKTTRDYIQDIDIGPLTPYLLEYPGVS